MWEKVHERSHLCSLLMGTARCPRQRFESIQETSYRVAATTGVAHMLSSSLQSLHSSYVVGSLANTYSLRGSLLSTTLNKLSLQGVLLWALGHSVRGGADTVPAFQEMLAFALHSMTGPFLSGYDLALMGLSFIFLHWGSQLGSASRH